MRKCVSIGGSTGPTPPPCNRTQPCLPEGSRILGAVGHSPPAQPRPGWNEFFRLATRDPSRGPPAVIIGIARGATIQRESSSTIGGNACSKYAITVRSRSQRVTSTIILNPRCEQACVICPGVDGCEATSHSLLRKGRGRANDKMTRN